MRVLVYKKGFLDSHPHGDYEVLGETESAYKLKDFLATGVNWWVEKNGSIYSCEELKEKIGE